jgi:hypothetical protein
MTELEIKATVRKRDGYQCRDCGRGVVLGKYLKKLDVHRLVPGSPYTLDGCITFCRRCHKRRHGGRKPKPAVRLSILISDDLAQSIRLRAFKLSVQLRRKVTVSEIVNGILCGSLAPEIQDTSS